MKTLTTIILMFLLASLTFAQAPSASNPQYFVATGVGFDSRSVPAASGLFAFGVRLDDGRTYTTSSIDLTGRTASFRQGIERILYQVGPVTLTAKGDAGITTVTGALGGIYGGGGSVVYDMSSWLHGKHIYAFGSGLVVKSSIGTPDSPTEKLIPVYRFGLVFPLGSQPVAARNRKRK